MFDKSAKTFPVKSKSDFFAHCAISPLYQGSAKEMMRYNQTMVVEGVSGLSQYFKVMDKFRSSVSSLLKVSPEDISYVHNTAEGLSMIAGGFPFASGDQVISYVHEYPSNHYPWQLQGRRGVELVLLPDAPEVALSRGHGRPVGWSIDDLDRMIGERTKIVALSHVQFTSGFAADLRELGALCKEKGVDLVIDCAQSLGCLPVYPEEYGISALVASAWKWLMGPWGAGVMYTSPEFREKISPVIAGPGMMRQGLDYLDLRWNPHDDGRKFEYSSIPWDHVAGMNAVFEEVFLDYAPEDIRDEVFSLQDRMMQILDRDRLSFVEFPQQHRSGILVAEVDMDLVRFLAEAQERAVVLSGPVGYLRFAPHFYNDEIQAERVADRINAILGER